VLVIDLLDAQGQPARLGLPLYEALIGDAEVTWALVIGSLRLLGAAHAEVVEFIADGAAWIWDRTERLTRLAEIPAAKLVEVLDFSHASPYLYETITTDRRLSKTQRQALYKRWRHALRHQADGVEVVLEALRVLATTQRDKAITRALRYVEVHAHRMRSVTLGGCPRIKTHGPWRLEEAGRSCSKGPCTSSREPTQLSIPRSDVLQRAIAVP
jgi:hypothetical protein